MSKNMTFPNRTDFICKECKTLKTFHDDRQEIICNGCGRTFDRKGKEIKDRPRTMHIGETWKISKLTTHGETRCISFFDKAFGDMFHMSLEEAKALKKFLNETV